MAFTNEHSEKMVTLKNYFNSVGLPVDKYSFVNYGDSDLWVCTYIDWDDFFTQDIKNKISEVGAKYDPRPRITKTN